jgi:Glycoside hydrolase 131 catalytic N-terminal domain
MLRQTLWISLAASLVAGSPVEPRAASPAVIKCPIIFDGRVPSTAQLSDFDSGNGGGWMPFNPGYVKGGSLAWSDIILLPTVSTPSRFDANGTVPLEVTLSDKSIFQSQNGFRRAGLQFSKDSNTGSPATKGVVTLHWSVMQDSKRKLNLTHEYLVRPRWPGGIRERSR